MHQQITFHSPRTHVTAAIVHGQGTYAYMDVHSWLHDSNLTINILLDILMRQEFLPPVLYLQLDNTARENKNQYTLSFLSYLVQMKIFSEVNFNRYATESVCVCVCCVCACCDTILIHHNIDPTQLPHGWSYARRHRSSFQSHLHLPSMKFCLHSLR